MVKDKSFRFPKVPREVLNSAIEKFDKATEKTISLDVALNQEFALYRFVDEFAKKYA